MIWVDVRIPRAALKRHADALLEISTLSRLELDPPAAGPEAQLSFGPYGSLNCEQKVVQDVEDLGIHVLASRTRASGWRPR